MEFNINQFKERLKFKLDSFALEEASEQCNELIRYLFQSNEPIPFEDAEKILQWLRNKRLFSVMLKLADTFLQSGIESFKIHRQYAQALIDSGGYTSAISVLDNLISTIKSEFPIDFLDQTEYIEANGLLGRLYKQLYVNAKNAQHPKCLDFLQKGITYYYKVYERNKSKIWHGINTVALLERAYRDNVEINSKLEFNLESNQIASEILDYVKKRYDEEAADAWDFATAAEACIALKKYDEALKWISGYSRMPYCDAFELASTHRQLVELWELDLESEEGKSVLPILRAELAKRMGATFSLDVKEIQKYQETEEEIKNRYGLLMEKEKSTPENPVLEKVFGEDSFNTFLWYNTGHSKFLSVARIGLEPSKGHGTGFLISSSHVLKGFSDELLLVTNSHVVSAHQDQQSLRPDEIVVIFEALNPNEEFRDLEIVWCSPSHELDACILRFSKSDQKRLESLVKNLKLYEPQKRLPAVKTSPPQKIYVIGHPNGGTLQISFQDNLLLDHDSKSKVHYRTPTEGGSSGSPVFNQQWGLIALHHAGSKEMPRLNGEPGIYEANEGIWIQAIIQKMKEDLNK